MKLFTVCLQGTILNYFKRISISCSEFHKTSRISWSQLYKVLSWTKLHIFYFSIKSSSWLRKTLKKRGPNVEPWGKKESACLGISLQQGKRTESIISVWQVIHFSTRFPDGICLVKVNNRNNRTMCEICSKSTKKTLAKLKERLSS